MANQISIFGFTHRVTISNILCKQVCRILSFTITGPTLTINQNVGLNYNIQIIHSFKFKHLTQININFTSALKILLNSKKEVGILLC